MRRDGSCGYTKNGWRRCRPLSCRWRKTILVEIAIVFAFIVASGLLAGAETAIMALRRGQVGELADSDSRGAQAVRVLRECPERLLATVQIGVTLLSTAAAAFGGYRAASSLAPALAKVPSLARYADPLGLALVVLVISYLSVVLGGLVPKSLALRSAKGYAVLAGRPLLWLSSLARPLTVLFTASSNVVLRIFGDQTNFSEARLSPEELSLMLDEAAKSGSVHPKAGEIARRALDFGDVTIGEVMVPRTRVVAIKSEASPEEVRQVLLEESHGHFPVYNGTLDEVVGVISTNDVLALAWERELIVLEDLLRPPHFVPESMRAADVLRELQRQRQHFAVVVDERGGTAGIVTIKDLLEELVGEIFGERDRDAPERIRQQSDGAYVVPGNMPVRDANRELPFELPEGENWSTVGGFCIALAGHIPAVGEHYATAEGLLLEVVDASPRRVRWVRIRPQPSAEKPGQPTIY